MDKGEVAGEVEADWESDQLKKEWGQEGLGSYFRSFVPSSTPRPEASLARQPGDQWGNNPEIKIVLATCEALYLSCYVKVVQPPLHTGLEDWPHPGLAYGASPNGMGVSFIALPQLCQGSVLSNTHPHPGFQPPTHLEQCHPESTAFSHITHHAKGQIIM